MKKAIFYKKLTKLYEKCVLKTPDCLVVKRTDGSYAGVAWNVDEKMSGREIKIDLTFPLNAKENVLITQLVDEEVCNPLKVWHDIGEPASLNQEQLELLRTSAQPFVKTERCGNKIKLVLKENAVCYFEIKEAPIKSDRGYTYGRLE